MFPSDFVTEARALGAEVTRTASGFVEVRPLYTRPDELKNVANLGDRPLLLEVLENIRTAARDREVLLNVNAPYSVLSLITPPERFYAWLARYPDEVHAALKTITAGLASYIKQAFAAGAKIVSLADPQAQPMLLGDVRYREYVADWQYRLLKLLTPSDGKGLLHLCPYGFFMLEKYGYVEVRAVDFPRRRYEDALFEAADGDGIVFAGRQCPHTRLTEHLYILKISATGAC
jgi:uroporphyrinogen-III decarboxylase